MREVARQDPGPCELRNCRQAGDAWRGAGLRPAEARIRQIVPSPDAVAEAEELTLDAPVPHRGFWLTSCWTRSRISSGSGERPVVFGKVHLFFQASVPGEERQLAEQLDHEQIDETKSTIA
jgi:hypothetical protein